MPTENNDDKKKSTRAFPKEEIMSSSELQETKDIKNKISIAYKKYKEEK